MKLAVNTLLPAVLLLSLAVACGKTPAPDEPTSPTEKVADADKSSATTELPKAVRECFTSGYGQPVICPDDEAKKAVGLDVDRNAPFSDYRLIDDGTQLAALYYAVSDLPVDYEKLAAATSRDFRSESDAFKKRDILKAIQPQLDAGLALARSNRKIRYDMEAQLQAYDFESKSFRLSSNVLPEGSSFYFNNSPASKLIFKNAATFQRIVVEDEGKAKTIEAMRTRYQGLTLSLYAQATGADLNQSAVEAEIVGVELVDKSGAVLAMSRAW